MAVLWLDLTNAYGPLPLHVGGGCTGETTSSTEGERRQPVIFQQVQLEGLFWPADIRLAPAGSVNFHQVHHLGDHFHAGNEHAG